MCTRDSHSKLEIKKSRLHLPLLCVMVITMWLDPYYENAIPWQNNYSSMLWCVWRSKWRSRDKVIPCLAREAASTEEGLTILPFCSNGRKLTKSTYSPSATLCQGHWTGSERCIYMFARPGEPIAREAFERRSLTIHSSGSICWCP